MPPICSQSGDAGEESHVRYCRHIAWYTVVKGKLSIHLAESEVDFSTACMS